MDHPAEDLAQAEPGRASRRRPRRPRHREIADELAAEIAAGAYPVGARFPTEQDLCARYGLGRHTVREALRGLEELGLITRQPGSGTVVRARTQAEFFAYRIQSLDSLWQYAAETRFHGRQAGAVVLHADLARTLGRSAGERWLRVAGLRCRERDGAPQCWTEIYLAEPYMDIRSRMADPTRPFYQAVMQHYGVVVEEVERRITTMAMPAAVAASLGVAAGSPAVLERRTYLDAGGKVFEVSLSLHPGEDFALTTRLVREPTRPIPKRRSRP